MYKIFFILILYITNTFSFETIEVISPDIIINKSGYFKTNKSLKPEEVLNKSFLPLPKTAKSFGFDDDEYWFIFDITNLSKEKIYLDSKDILAGYQNLYVYKDNKLIRDEKSGFYLKNDEKQIKVFSSRFELEANSQNVIYLLKINNDFMRLCSFTFGSEKDIEKDWKVLEIIFTITITLVIYFTLQSIILYIYTLEKVFVYYCIYLLGLFFSNLFTISYIPYIIFNIDIITDINLWIFFIIVTIIGITYFTIEFLNLHLYPNMKKNILWLTFISIILTPFYIYSNIIPYSQSLWLITIVFFQIYLLFISVKRYIEGDYYARC